MSVLRQWTILLTACTCRPCLERLMSVTIRQPPSGSSSGRSPMARDRSMTDSELPRRVATPLTWGCDSGSLVSGGQGMISLTLSRLIAISLPLRRVNSSSDSESARAFCDAIGTFRAE
ncbi:hypothetical protein D3C80_991100 [compost metagenome]